MRPEHLRERLRSTTQLTAEAVGLAEGLGKADPDDDVQVIEEFARVAKLRQIAQQLGWREDLPDIEAEYTDLAAQVHRIIEREVVLA